MSEALKNFWNHERVKHILDIRNIGLYVFSIIVLAISWSGVKAVQNNYELQKKISELKQQNAVLELRNTNTDLQNRYLQTDQYLELAARQNLGLAAPGEKVLIVPKSVSLKYVDKSLVPATSATKESADKRSRFAKNIESWRDFLLGRKLTED